MAVLAMVVFGLSAHVNAKGDLDKLKNAVVKIHTTATPPDYFTPWRLLNATQTSGSGSVISGNRILTNAHVVADATYIQAQKHGDPKKYLARVAFVSHEADLAILTVEDTSFFEGLRPLSLGSLPEPMQEVAVYGYPFGGSTLSITQGILSRVEHQYYAHAGAYLLAGQIDAAINPGNSGGPVIVNNRIVGVVMQANTNGRAENLGYFVPPSVIKHVLEDAEDGQHHGFADLGFRTQELESPALQQAYGIVDGRGGALVAHVFSDSAAAGHIEANDVLIKVDGHEIAADGTIEFRPGMRTNFKYALDQYHWGDTLPVQLVRDGQLRDIELQVLGAPRNFGVVLPQQFDKAPQYLIYGGVVFVPLNMNLIKRWGRDWHRQAPVDFLHARNQHSSPDQQELVVALKVLAADVNLGYHDWKNWILSSVNGKSIKTFAQFCQAVLNDPREFTAFKDEEGYQMVINHRQAQESEALILQRYRIPVSHQCGA